MQKRRAKIFFISLVGVAVTLAAGAYLSGALRDGLCGNTLIQSEAGPDGTVKALLFERSCGATSGFSSQVSIIDVEDELGNEPGNVFIAEAGEESSGSSSRGGPMVELRWREPGVLEVRRDPHAEIFRAVERLGAVRVIYLTK